MINIKMVQFINGCNFQSIQSIFKRDNALAQGWHITF